MRFLFLLIVLIFQIPTGQSQPIEVVIDKVSEDDSDPKERKFTINYHLSNLTDKKLSFFLKPDGLVSNNFGSMSNHPYYKIYQNDQFLNLGNVFGRPKKGEKYETLKIDPKNITDETIEYLRTELELNDTLIAELKQYGTFKSPVKFKNDNSLMESVLSLEPKETKTFSKVLYWDKDRYFFHDPEEFYLSETEKHYIEITVLLMKEPFKDKLKKEEYDAIMANPNFIKGVFTSNKAEINFN